MFASLICIIDDRVLLAFRLDGMGVLFCLIIEKTLSYPALLCTVWSPTVISREFICNVTSSVHELWQKVGEEGDEKTRGSANLLRLRI